MIRRMRPVAAFGRSVLLGLPARGLCVSTCPVEVFTDNGNWRANGSNNSELNLSGDVNNGADTASFKARYESSAEEGEIS